MGQNSSQVQVNGTCEEKFQPVKEKLEQMLQKGKNLWFGGLLKWICWAGQYGNIEYVVSSRRIQN